MAHTAHVNAVDREGMLAALTFTHGPAWFGGRWAIAGSGVVMNGGMHNFGRSAPVRHGSCRFGVSNMTPTIATNGRVGLSRIPPRISSSLCIRKPAAEGRCSAMPAVEVA